MLESLNISKAAITRRDALLLKQDMCLGEMLGKVSCPSALPRTRVQRLEPAPLFEATHSVPLKVEVGGLS